MPKKNKVKKLYKKNENLLNNSLDEIECIKVIKSEKITYLQRLKDGTICSGTELGNIYIYNQNNFVELLKIISL